VGRSQGVTVALCNSALDEGRKLELSDYLAAAASESQYPPKGEDTTRRHLQE